MDRVSSVRPASSAPLRTVSSPRPAAQIASASASSLAKSAASQIAAVLTTSAMPLLSSRGGSVPSHAASTNTNSGWWNAPSRFLPWGWSIAVFPPIAESTMASSVVGTCTRRSPRMNVAATKPTRSPTTPPPTAITTASRVTRSESIQSSIAALPSRLLLCSPAGTA